ncbi:MAG TPA: glutathione peroxidase [Bacteroidales bacterium]|nr:glutathione peroxidase [Bacteroidales bacterium]
MKQKIIFLFLITMTFAFLEPAIAQKPKTLYDFTVKDIDGKPYNLADLKGKKVLVVNTASKCGQTPQYADLEKLYKEYADQDFMIIGFPANNFAGQEPGTNEEIKNFCQANYGVSFPMMSKVSVKGEDMDPLYKWLTTKELNGVMDTEVGWNFQKYLIDANGYLVDMVPSKEKPDTEKIMNWIKN